MDQRIVYNYSQIPNGKKLLNTIKATRFNLDTMRFTGKIKREDPVKQRKIMVIVGKNLEYAQYSII